MKRVLALGMEEVANVATHGLGLVASLAILPILILIAARGGDAGTIVGVTIFGVTLVGVYAASTIYHSVSHGPRRQLWRRLDQSAVFFLIAGTYTPFALGPLRGPLGWTVFGIVWAAALTGATLKLARRLESPRLDNATYLAMGWLVLLIAGPLVQRIGLQGLTLLAAGGVTYTAGVGFLACQSRIRWGHCAWHVFVLMGSACHAIAVLNYAIVNRT